jgi:hypothetical protein
MTYALTKEEKLAVIETHMKNVLFNKYNAELSLLQEQAVSSPKAQNIQATSDTSAQSDAQLIALQQEHDLVAGTE